MIISDEYREKMPEFIRIIHVKNEKLIKLASAFLGKGEAEVIALALEHDAEGVILDDKKGFSALNEKNHKFTYH